MVYEYSGEKLQDGLYFFYASWNSSCNVLKERVTKLNIEFQNLNIFRVNTTKYASLKQKFAVKRIPSYLLIKEEQVVSRKDGNIDYYSLKQWLREGMK